MLWYVLERYVHCDMGISYLNEVVERPILTTNEEPLHFTKQVILTYQVLKYASFMCKLLAIQFLIFQELHGIKAIVTYLHILPPHKKCVPSLINNPIELIRKVAIVIGKHKNDKPEDAITGKPILRILSDKVRYFSIFFFFYHKNVPDLVFYSYFEKREEKKKATNLLEILVIN